jgi:hypothetical protein
MRDPRFSPIFLQIERTLCTTDASAHARGVTLTDSNIRSLLVRAINDARGRTTKSAGMAASEKDRAIAGALRDLRTMRAAMVEERDQSDGSVERRPLSTSHWIAALETIKDSCESRRGPESGARGCLEFLREFLKDTERAE